MAAEATENIMKNNSDDMNIVLKAAAIIRKELLSLIEWKFEGSIENYKCPQILTSLVKWIIAGPKINIDATSKEMSVDRSSINIVQENKALVKALEKFVVDLYVSSKKCPRNISRPFSRSRITNSTDITWM